MLAISSPFINSAFLKPILELLTNQTDGRLVYIDDYVSLKSPIDFI